MEDSYSFKDIGRFNSSPHSRFILRVLYFEKKNSAKRNIILASFYKFLRIVLVQAVYHVELDPKSVTLDSICSLRLPHPYNIIIHGDSTLGVRCTIFQNVTIGSREREGNVFPPRIGNNVYIGVNSVVIGDIDISDNSKIGASAIVLKDVPSNSTICGIYK